VKCDLILFMSSKDVLVNINSSICFLKDLNHRIQNTLPMKLEQITNCLIRFVVSKVVLRLPDDHNWIQFVLVKDCFTAVIYF
jgi:hypothetical protein